MSTTQSGTVELGLSNIPMDRPVLFVGNHVFMGLDLSLVIGEVFKERNLLIRGLGHPVLFRKEAESDLQVCCSFLQPVFSLTKEKLTCSCRSTVNRLDRIEVQVTGQNYFLLGPLSPSFSFMNLNSTDKIH